MVKGHALSTIFCSLVTSLVSLAGCGEDTDMSPNLLEIQVLVRANWKFSLASFPSTCLAICQSAIKGVQSRGLGQIQFSRLGSTIPPLTLHHQKSG